MNEGWICPKCQKVLAPWVRECNCQIDVLPSWVPWPEYPITPWPSTGTPLLPYPFTICES